MRTYIIDTIGEIGGHFGANLGTCELAVALHSLLDSPRDKVLWDVGHQAYPHKILTGRREALPTIRQYERPGPVLLDLRVRARHHGRRPRLDLDRLRGRPEGGDAQGDRRGRQGRRRDRRRRADRRRRLRGAARRRRPADADRDRPQRQRDVDLAQRRRALALLQPGPAQPAPLPRPRGGRGPADQAAARPRQADRAARPGDQVGDQGLLGARPLLRGARPRLHGRDRRPRRPRPARGADARPSRPTARSSSTSTPSRARASRPAEEGGLEAMEKWHAAKPNSIVNGRPPARRSRCRCTETDSPEGIAPSGWRSRRPPARRRSTRRSSPTRWSPRPSATSG